MSLWLEKHRSIPFTFRKSTNASNVVRTQTLSGANDEAIFTSLQRLLNAAQNNIFRVNYETFRWSFFEQLKIDPYTTFIGPAAYENIKHIFKRFNYRSGARSLLRGNPGQNLLDQIYGLPLGSCKFDIVDTQTRSLYLLLNNTCPSVSYNHTDYKIHFAVKEEYALYVLLKAQKIMLERSSALGRKELLSGKIMLNFNETLVPKLASAENSWFSGNLIPTVVIYINSHLAADAKDVIEKFIRGFPEYKEIGLMSAGHPEKIPYGNVRINELICYAHGDRAEKLMLKRHNYGFYVSEDAAKVGINSAVYNVSKNTDGLILYKKRSTGKNTALRSEIGLPLLDGMTGNYKHIPGWLQGMMTACDGNSDIAKRSMHFFGTDMLCTGGLDTTCKIEPFCYLTYNKDMLDPNTIIGIEGLEPTNEFSRLEPTSVPLDIACIDAFHMCDRLYSALLLLLKERPNENMDDPVVKSLLQDCVHTKKTYLEQLEYVYTELNKLSLMPENTNMAAIFQDERNIMLNNLLRLVRIVSELTGLGPTMKRDLVAAYEKLYTLKMAVETRIKKTNFNGGKRKTYRCRSTAAPARSSVRAAGRQNA